MRKFRGGLIGPAMAAVLGGNAYSADLTGVSIDAKWLFPNLASVIAEQTLVDGPGVEISCPAVSGAFCTAWARTTVSYDFGSNFITFSAPFGTGHAAASFNGYQFSGLASGGAWASATLTTNISGLGSSRLSFDGNTVQLNVQGLSLQQGAYWTVTLAPAVPEAGTTAMLLAGLMVLGWGAAARRSR